MSARTAQPPGNVVSLAECRRQLPTMTMAPDYSGPGLENARIVAEFARRLGCDLRLVAAIQRGDIPPAA
jgi:hypothetical protein